MEYNGMQWNTMEYNEIRWNTMDHSDPFGVVNRSMMFYVIIKYQLRAVQTMNWRINGCKLPVLNEISVLRCDFTHSIALTCLSFTKRGVLAQVPRFLCKFDSINFGGQAERTVVET